MGAQSDFIGERFVPNDRYKAQQLAMAQKLIAAGVCAEQLDQMFFVPCDLLSGKRSENR
jgi:hypothetical protein